MCPVPSHSEQELCGFVIWANWICAPYHERQTKAFAKNRPVNFYVIVVGPANCDPSTDFPFLLCHQKGSTQRLESSASFDPVESICPSTLLVFYPEDGQPLGPYKESLPTCVRYNAFKQNHLSGSSLFGRFLSTPEAFVT